MTHVDEGALLTLVDGELDAAEKARVEHHLDECGVCREELDRVRDAASVFRTALRESDAPLPVASETTARALRRRSAGGRGGGWRDLSRAAVLVLGFAAAASATIPGSPVNRWIRDLAQPEPRASVETERAEAPAPAAVASSDSFVAESGVSVMPEAGAVHVVLRGATPELRVKAVLVERPRAGVYAAGEASGARFSTAPGRIEVAGAASGELRIELPQSARVASVEINGRQYLSKEGDQLRLAVPAEESAGAEVTFRILQ